MRASRCHNSTGGVKWIAHLDIQGVGRIRLNQFAQARNLYIQATVKDFIFTSTRHFHQFFAGKWLAGIAGEYLEYRKLACRQWHGLAIFFQCAGSQIKYEVAELK